MDAQQEQTQSTQKKVKLTKLELADDSRGLHHPVSVQTITCYYERAGKLRMRIFPGWMAFKFWFGHEIRPYTQDGQMGQANEKTMKELAMEIGVYK